MISGTIPIPLLSAVPLFPLVICSQTSKGWDRAYFFYENCLWHILGPLLFFLYLPNVFGFVLTYYLCKLGIAPFFGGSYFPEGHWIFPRPRCFCGWCFTEGSVQTPGSLSRAESTLAGQHEEADSAATCAIDTKIKGRPHSLNYAHYVLKRETQECFVLYISHLHQREFLPSSVPRMGASGLLWDSVRQEEFFGSWNANKHFKHLSWLLESLYPAPRSVISFYKKKACAIFHTNHMLF